MYMMYVVMKSKRKRSYPYHLLNIKRDENFPKLLLFFFPPEIYHLLKYINMC